MRENNGTNLATKWNNGVIYVEPNHMVRPNLNTVDVEYTHDLEDYCIYCDLECEVASKHQNIRTKLFNIQFTTRLNDSDATYTDTHISWLGGSEYGDTRTLTTSYSDVSYKTVQDHSAKDKSERELFGINSISIKYDAWVTPTVSIKFTDIRGMSLFSPEEYSHPLYTPDGMTGQSGGEDITGSFFRALFTFPYPKFKLYVKGFYGHPICYDMAVNKFNATFDSKTGNFGADVDFVGFKFGLLNDLTMTSLAAAVSSEEGRKYFDGQIENGRFLDGGKNLYRLSYLAWIFSKFKTALSDLESKYQKEKNEALAKIDEEKAEKDKLKPVWDAYVDYFSNGVGCVAKNLAKKYKDYHTSLVSSMVDLPFRPQYTVSEYNEKYKGDIEKIRYIGPTNGNRMGEFDLYIPDSSLDSVDLETGYGKTQMWVYKGKFDNPGTCNTSTMCRCDVSLNDEKKLLADKPLGDVYFHSTKFINNSNWTFYMTSFVDVNEEYPNIPNVSLFDYFEKYNRLNFIDSKTGESKIYLNSSSVFSWKMQEYPFSNIKKEGTWNKDLFESQKVEEKYNKVISAMDTCLNSITDEKLKKKCQKCFQLFKDQPKLNELCPTYDEWGFFPRNFDVLHTHGYDDNNPVPFKGTSFRKSYLSHYKLDFYEFRTQLKELQTTKSKEDVENELGEKQKKATEKLMNDMLNINGGLRFIMKSLWAHVETFLVLCSEAKTNIFDSKRTVEELGLNTENSSLPRKAYDDISKMTVAPFPTYLGKETLKDGAEKMSYKYIGIDHPDLEECSLVEKLIYGASRYYNWAHFGEKDHNGNAINKSKNVYNESTDEIRLAIYSYLQNFFDKWMYSIPNSVQGIQKEWGVDYYFEDHFLFIDVFYNKIGDEIGLNKEKVCSMCNDIFEHKNNTLMTFMTTLLQDINTILQPTQGFMLNEINNAEQPYQFYDRLFTPVPFNKMKEPDSAPFFVVIHRGEPSKHLDTGYGDENDSFMISEDMDNLINEQPIGLRTKNLDKGYLIPAIGVSYGKQYQSYFTDVQVDMNVQMANEVALAAQYNLAGVSVKENSGGNEHILHLGQDLFTIYANNSYTCTVTMLGCMWIQPLMYFQLNNIPMYRGTYMVQKVYHDIAPGTMTTKFTGVRMSKFSSPFLNKSVSSSGRMDKESQMEEKRYTSASFDNDCPYKIYDPTHFDGRGAFTKEWLEQDFGEIFPNHAPDCSIWYGKVKNHSVCEALASIIKFEDSGDDVSCGLHATVLYNALYANYFIENSKAKKGVYIIDGSVGSIYSDNNSTSEWSFLRWNVIGNSGSGAKGTECGNWVSSEDEKDKAEKERICAIVEDVFTHSPLTLEGKIARTSQGIEKELSEDGLSQIISTYGYNAGYGKAHKTPLIYQHKSNKRNESGYFANKNNYHFWTKDTVSQNSNDTNNSSDTDEKFGNRFLECITKTFNRYEKLNSDKFEDLLNTSIDKEKCIITFTSKKKEISLTMPLLLDILFNGNNSNKSYHKYINKLICNWETTVSNSSYPDTIQLKWDKEGGIVETELSFTQGAIGSDVAFVIEKDTMPEEFYKILKKKYVTLDNNDKLNRYVKNSFG